MSNYNIEYFLADFSDRTIKNLNHIEMHLDENLFEVTQLVNSFLGLIIIPYEAYRSKDKLKNEEFKAISEKDHKSIMDFLQRCKLEKRLYSDYNDLYDKETKEPSISGFIRHIRNSIAHGGSNGIHFFPVSEKKKIDYIIFYDNDAISKNKMIHEFIIKIKVEELRSLVCCISNLYCKFESKDEKVSSKKKKYEKTIESLDRYLKEGRTDKSKTVFQLKGNN